MLTKGSPRKPPTRWKKRAENVRKSTLIFAGFLDREDVDAVIVGTPDHWHALPTIMACQAGKDVYCEKPLATSIAEGRAMVNAARKHNRIVQVGDSAAERSTLLRCHRFCEIRRTREGPPSSVPGPFSTGKVNFRSRKTAILPRGLITISGWDRRPSTRSMRTGSISISAGIGITPVAS